MDKKTNEDTQKGFQKFMKGILHMERSFGIARRLCQEVGAHEGEECPNCAIAFTYVRGLTVAAMERGAVLCDGRADSAHLEGRPDIANEARKCGETVRRGEVLEIAKARRKEEENPKLGPAPEGADPHEVGEAWALLASRHYETGLRVTMGTGVPEEVIVSMIEAYRTGVLDAYLDGWERKDARPAL